MRKRRSSASGCRSKRGGEKVEFFVPKDGQPHELVQMAAENASETLQALRAQWQADTHKQEQALGELQSALKLSAPPNRIECYDISQHTGHGHCRRDGRFRRRACPIKSCIANSTLTAPASARPMTLPRWRKCSRADSEGGEASQETEARPGVQAGCVVLLPA